MSDEQTMPDDLVKVNTVGWDADAMQEHVFDCHDAIRTLTAELDDAKQATCRDDHDLNQPGETLGDVVRGIISELATVKAERNALVEAASQLRQAQRDYMADRGNDAKGKIVGQKAKALDATLAQLKEQDDD